MKRRYFLFGSLAVGAGCTSVSAVHGTGNAFTIPGTLRFSDGEDIGGLNLHIVPQVSVQQLSQLTGAYLIRFDDRYRPYPELLDRIPSLANGDISRDGLSITFRLKPGLVWDDGHPLQSDDVKFSFDAVNNPRNNEYSRTGFDQIVDVAASDALTTTVKLKNPLGSFCRSISWDHCPTSIRHRTTHCRWAPGRSNMSRGAGTRLWRWLRTSDTIAVAPSSTESSTRSFRIGTRSKR
jgi:ABC-type transport system substrate-binding protein